MYYPRLVFGRPRPVVKALLSLVSVCLTASVTVGPSKNAYSCALRYFHVSVVAYCVWRGSVLSRAATLRVVPFFTRFAIVVTVFATGTAVARIMLAPRATGVSRIPECDRFWQRRRGAFNRWQVRRSRPEIDSILQTTEPVTGQRLEEGEDSLTSGFVAVVRIVVCQPLVCVTVHLRIIFLALCPVEGAVDFNARNISVLSPSRTGSEEGDEFVAQVGQVVVGRDLSAQQHHNADSGSAGLILIGTCQEQR